MNITYGSLLRFFIPLGFSVTLVTLSHVIINSTLARSDHAAMVIASYSIAFSFFTILERCVVIFRQTSSALVRDQISYRAMLKVSVYILGAVLAISLGIAFTDAGRWIFQYGFGVHENLLLPTIDAYKVLLFVTVFSGIRCFYQGIIISHLRTKWMTIMMIVRLFMMILIAWLVLRNGWVNHGYIGAYIFLIGMAVEALVSTAEGLYLVKHLPEKKRDHTIETQRQVFVFYRPLLLASLISVMINPSINAALGWSEKGALAVAAFSIAASVSQLFMSFTTYMHQMAINFYEKDPKKVIRMVIFLGLLPSLSLACISFTGIGDWILQDMMGVTGPLLEESLLTLRFFIFLTLMFPFLDFVNGMLILNKRTHIMMISQTGNLAITLLVLLTLSYFAPQLGGVMGILSLASGVLVELLIVLSFRPNQAAGVRHGKIQFRDLKQ